MKLLQRHYIKEFFIALTIIGLGLSIIFSLVNLIDKLDDFMKWNPPVGDLLLYVALNVPKNLFYLLPMAILICSLFVFTNAMKKNEIVVVKAAGGRMRLLLVPFIITGFILSTSAFFLGESVMPAALERAEELRIKITSPRHRDIRGTLKTQPYQRLSLVEGTLWLRDKGGSIVRIGLYSYEGISANDIKIFLFDKGDLSEQLEAEKALWNGKTWVLLNVRRYIFKGGEIHNIKELPYPNLEAPKFFLERVKKIEEMRIIELVRYIKRLKQSGYRNPKLIVDFNSRLSYPFINLFMLILGVSLPLKSRIVKGIIASGIGLAISLIYWGGYILSLSLGNAGIIPPFLAPWLMPAIFATISINLFRKLHE
ncbi:MAG: LptF/LptG family permease [Nitrospirota bacterium]